MKTENYEEKPYLSQMNIHDARINFSIRSRMFNCKMNFLNHPKNKAENWRCDSCQTCVDSQSHILYCSSYKQLREGKSLSSDQDIVTYFKEVLAIRIKLDLDKWICDLVLMTAKASLPRTSSWGRRYAGMELITCSSLPNWQFVFWKN